MATKRVVEVVEAKRWKNAKTGEVASIYGAHPATTEAERADWEVEVVGFTWRLADGTVGLGRPPAKTRAEAEAVMAQINAR